MPVLVVGPELDLIPGAPSPSTRILGNVRPRVFVYSGLTFGSLWARAGSPRNADIALTLVYDSTLSRVRITGTGMDVFSLATVERSTNQVSWATVRGGGTVSVAAGTVKLDDYEFAPNVTNYYRVRTLVPFGQSEVASIIPTLTTPWLKSIARPFLNRQIEFGGDQLIIQRPPRGGVFDVVGRSLPVAVTEVRGSRRYVVVLRTETADQAEDLDMLFASGDVLFTHGSQCRVPSGVYWFGGITEELEPTPEDSWRLTSAEVVEVTAPGPDVVGATSTWQTVINTYATWADVIAAKASWFDLMDLVGDPSEIVVP